MASVDERIVSMTFDNSSFERKLGETITSLEKLNTSLQFSNANKAFSDLNNSAQQFDTSHMADALDKIGGKFTALGAIGFSVIQSLTQDVISFATRTATEDVLGPIITGGKQRALNIEQAKFQFRGLGVDVEAGMASALAAVKGTAFGLDEAAKAASQLSASGIQTGDQMTSILRGIAGTAAMTGSTFSEMSDIFTASAGSGKVNTQDLLQFSTRGLNAAAAVAKQMHLTEAQVRDMASAGKLDFATFAKAMDDAFGAHATAANETYAGSLANVHAAMSRLGAAFFTPRLEQQRDLFNALTPVIDNVAAALKPVIDAFTAVGRLSTNALVDKLGKLDLSNFTLAMPNIGEAIINAFAGISTILAPIKAAFRDIFPPQTESIVIKLSEAIKAFSEHLKVSADTATKIRSIFKGFFSVIEIGWTIFKELILVIKDIVGVLRPAGSGLLDVGAASGEFVTRMNEILVAGGGIHNFFVKLKQVVIDPIKFLQELRDKITDFFGSFSRSGDAEVSMGRVGDRMDEMRDIADKVSDAWKNLTDRLQGVFAVFDQVWDYIKNWFGELGSKIAAAFQPGDFNSAVDIINVGLLGGIVLMLKKFLSGGLKIDFGTGIIDKIKGALDGVTGSLQAMQINLKAQALIKIAEAMAILTASIVVLSLIDSDALTKALAAIVFGFGELATMMAVMDKIVSGKDAAVKMGLLGLALIELSIAIDLLSLALAGLSRLDMAGIGKGLLGVGGALALMTGFIKIVGGGDVSGLIRAGFAMIVISTSLLILSQAVQSFATMDWTTMGRGLAGVAAGLALITLAMNFMPAESVLGGLGFIAVAVGLTILYGAVKLFSTFSWADMAKGMVGIAGGLLIIAGAMQLMPVSMVLTGPALIAVAIALGMLAGSVALMGAMDMGTLAKGIGAIAAMLLILAIGAIAMEEALPGAAAMVVMAGALTIMSHVLETLGNLEVSQIVQGLLALVAVFAVIGLAGLLLGPVIPEILGLGVALALLGAGIALFGFGAAQLAKAFQLMAESGVAGAKAFIEATKIIITAIPEILGAVVQAIVGSGEELLKAMPLMIRIVEALLSQLFETITKLAPQLAQALITVFVEGLRMLREVYPEFVKTGFEMLMALLQGIKDNISDIVNTVVDIVVNFINALNLRLPDIIQAVYDFILGLATGLAEKAGEFQTAFIPIGEAFIKGLLDGINHDIPFAYDLFVGLPLKVIGWIGDVASTLYNKGSDFIVGILNGLHDKALDIAAWFIALPGVIFATIGDVLPTLVSKGWDLITGLISGLGQKELDGINFMIGLPGRLAGAMGDVLSSLWSKGWDFIQGLINGIISAVDGLRTWFETLPDKVKNFIPNPLDILYDIGKKVIDGLINGIKAGLDALGNVLGGVGGFIADHKGPPEKDVLILHNAGLLIMKGLRNGLMDGWKPVENWLESIDPAESINFDLTPVIKQLNTQLAGMNEFNPVITPVVDLAKVEEASKQLEQFMRLSPEITPEMSLKQARLISTTSEIDKTGGITPPSTTPTEVTFNQNIYSPDALSTNDIYRNTKSQIALAREELGIK